MSKEMHFILFQLYIFNDSFYQYHKDYCWHYLMRNFISYDPNAKCKTSYKIETGDSATTFLYV